MKILTAAGALLLLAALMFGQGDARKDLAITAATGESWLHHLHRSFDETSMGRTWSLGPPSPAMDKATPRMRLTGLSDTSAAGSRTRARILHGSDLYRLNCQGCHGESGRGAPPEIGSLIDPVRATSTALIAQRMEKIGMTMSHQQTAEIANQSKQALFTRLHQGGTDMPSFHHLREAELRALFAYLKQLASVPGAENEQVAIQESRLRVGELIVKSTCHVCHDATGLNPTSEELSGGAIPPLSVLPERVSQAQLVQKVTSGAPVIMGTASLVYRGRMPVFGYLSENEAASVYDYLTSYPPTDSASLIQTPQPSPPNATPDPPAAGAIATQSALAPVRVPPQQTEFATLPLGMGLFVGALLALGCWTTWREFRKLSLKSHDRGESRAPGINPGPWITLHRPDEQRLDSPHLRTEPAELTLELDRSKKNFVGD